MLSPLKDEVDSVRRIVSRISSRSSGGMARRERVRGDGEGRRRTWASVPRFKRGKRGVRYESSGEMGR